MQHEAEGYLSSVTDNNYSVTQDTYNTHEDTIYNEMTREMQSSRAGASEELYYSTTSTVFVSDAESSDLHPPNSAVQRGPPPSIAQLEKSPEFESFRKGHPGATTTIIVNNLETQDKEDAFQSSSEELQDAAADIQKKKEKRTPLPKGAILAASIVFICEGFAYSFLFPFVGFMIMDFGLVKEERETGYYAGMLAGSFSLCQVFSGFIFGVMADRVSKRAVVMVSTIGSMVTMLLFGLSPSFGFALAMRGLNGALNGNTATGKAYISDVTDATNQDVAFSFVGLAWGIGAICGPAIGGFLARPATQYPPIFGNIAILHQFPYLLPCIFQAILMFIGFVCTGIFMKPASQLGIGTPSNVQRSDEERSEDEPGDIEMGEYSVSSSEGLSMETDEEEYVHHMARASSEQQFLDSLDNDGEALLDTSSKSQITTRQSLPRRIGQGLKAVLRMCLNEAKELWRLSLIWDVFLSIMLYGLVSAIDTFHEELMPLWAMIPRDQGGLSFTTTTIGTVQMFLGVLLLSQPLVFPIFSRILGKRNSLIVGMLFIVPLAITPQISYLGRLSDYVLYAGLAVYCFLRYMFSMLTFTAVFILINNSAPPGTAGRVMSFSNSIGCVSRTVAPFFAGPFFAFFANTLASIPLIALNPAFIVVSLIGMFAALITFLLPKTIEEPKKASGQTK